MAYTPFPATEISTFFITQSKALGPLRWSGCELGLCERVDDDRLASPSAEVGWMRACRQAYRSRVRSEIGRRDLGEREGLGGHWRGRRALRREGEVGTRD